MTNKKEINPKDIDASFIISSFKNKERRNNPSSVPRPLLPPEKKEEDFREHTEESIQQVTPTPDTRTRKKKGQASYKETFIRRNEIKTRDCVYISHDIHTKITKLVRALEDTTITIGGYIDTVLSEHLEQHKDEINEIYRQSREDLL